MITQNVVQDWNQDVQPLCSLLMKLVVSGATGASDGLREAVHTAEQQFELPGVLQHPATGQQSDQVRGQHLFMEGILGNSLITLQTLA